MTLRTGVPPPLLRLPSLLWASRTLLGRCIGLVWFWIAGLGFVTAADGSCFLLNIGLFLFLLLRSSIDLIHLSLAVFLLTGRDIVDVNPWPSTAAEGDKRAAPFLQYLASVSAEPGGMRLGATRLACLL